MKPNNRFWTVFLTIIALVYVANSFSPFRLTNDTVRYFALMEHLLGTWPSTFGWSKDFLPPGYVYFLAGLERLHILMPVVICIFQMLYLAGSLFFVKKIFGSSLNTLPFVCFVLLSWNVLKFTITPLSELQFLFFTTGAIYYYQLAIKQRRLVHLIATLLFCSIALLTRTAGVTLLAALLLSFLIGTRKEWLLRLQKHKVLALSVGLSIIALSVFIVMQSAIATYVSIFFKSLMRHPAAFFTRNVRLHLMEWAELFFNIPYAKTGFLLPAFWSGLLYLLSGIFFLGFVLWKMTVKKKNVPLPVRVYLITYSLLIFNWPYFETRFWLPLIPFIVAIVLQKSEEPKRWYARAEMLFACGYILSGVFVFGYYSNLSFNRQALINRHDEGKWKQEYEYHFRMRSKVDSATMDFKALYLLEKYDR